MRRVTKGGKEGMPRVTKGGKEEKGYAWSRTARMRARSASVSVALPWSMLRGWPMTSSRSYPVRLERGGQ